MKSIKISVIIPTYNNGAKIINPINCIKKQIIPASVKVEFEIIIIDDASSVEKYEQVKEVVKAEENIKLIRCTKNGGPSIARNIGIKEATGEFISFLDSDDLWPENKIQLLLPIFEDTKIEVAGGKVKYMIKDGIDFNIIQEKYEDDQLRTTHVHLGALLVRKNIFDRGYLFDEELRFSEDIDWWNRIREDGINIMLLEETTLKYFIHGENMTFKKIRELNQSLLVVMHKAIKRRKIKKLTHKIPQIKDFRKQRNDVLISVIIPMYNGKNSIGRAIQSVKDQIYNNYEIILVDDGSTDNGANWVKNNFPEVNVIQQENKGVSAARNTGIKESNGDIIAFLDDDDVWLPEKLEKQLAELLKDPYCGWVTCNQKFFWEDNIQRPDFFKSETEKPHRSFVPSSLMIRKHIFISLNGFDESLKRAEDLDLIRRLREHNIKSKNVDEVLLEKWYDGNNLTLVADEGRKSLLQLLHKQIKKENGEN